MAGVQHSGDLKILNLTKALHDLKGIKSQESNKISVLENQIESLGESESRLKCMVVDLETEIRTDNRQCSVLEREIADYQRKHEREKGEFESVMEQANKRIESLSKELEKVGLQQLQEKTDKITALQNSLTTLQAQFEKEWRANEDKRKEIEGKNAEMMEQLSKIRETVDMLDEELEKVTNKNEQERMEKAELEKKVCQCQHVILHKNEIIKSLEQTIESGREMLVKESDFDLVIKKMKETRMENANLQLENFMCDQENKKLTQENSALKQKIHQYGQQETQNLSLLNNSLGQENQRLQERIVNHAAYQELYEAAQKELQMLKAKVELEREKLNARIAELEREKQSNIAKLISLENENIEKLKAISSLRLRNGL